MREDDSGQFILLMSIVVAIGLVIILIFLNQSMMAGHSSAVSIMDFPKNDIRNIRTATLDEARIIGATMNDQINADRGSYVNDTDAFNSKFNNNFTAYAVQVKESYAEKGAVVDITCVNNVRQVPMDNTTNRSIYLGDNTTIGLYYYNGETAYNDTTTVYYKL